MSFAKQVIGGTAVITIAGIGGRLVSILTVPIVSALLGPAPYGVASLVGTVVSLASVLALLGIDMAYARYYLQEDTLQRPSVERYCWRFAARGSIVAALLAGGGWYWLGSRWLDNYRSIALYTVFAIILSAIVTMASTRIRLQGNYRRIAVALLMASLLSSALSVGMALFCRQDAWVLLFSAIATSLITLLILGFPAITILWRPSHLPRSTKHAIVTLGLAGSVTAPMHWIISSADRWFIGHYDTIAEIGIYSMASNLAMLGLMLNSSLILTWFPEASRLFGQNGEAALDALGRLWSRLVVGLALVWLTVAAAGGDVLRLLAAPAFHSGAQYIPWLAGGVFFYGLAAMANTALFLQDRMRFAAYIWILGAVFCIGLNFMLVPHLGALGAAMAQCFSYGLIALCIIAVSHRIMPMPIPYFRLTIILLTLGGAGYLMLPAWSETPARSLLLKFPAGLLFALTIFYVIAPDWHQRLRVSVFGIFSRGKD